MSTSEVLTGTANTTLEDHMHEMNDSQGARFARMRENLAIIEEMEGLLQLFKEVEQNAQLQPFLPRKWFENMFFARAREIGGGRIVGKPAMESLEEMTRMVKLHRELEESGFHDLGGYFVYSMQLAKADLFSETYGADVCSSPPSPNALLIPIFDWNRQTDMYAQIDSSKETDPECWGAGDEIPQIHIKSIPCGKAKVCSDGEGDLLLSYDLCRGAYDVWKGAGNGWEGTKGRVCVTALLPSLQIVANEAQLLLHFQASNKVLIKGCRGSQAKEDVLLEVAETSDVGKLLGVLQVRSCSDVDCRIEGSNSDLNEVVEGFEKMDVSGLSLLDRDIWSC